MPHKKSQGASEVFKYLLVMLITAVILVGGYKVINIINSRSCQADLAKFEIGIKNIDKNLRYGEKELKTFTVPCNSDKIYMLDLKKLNSGYTVGTFSSVPVIKNSLQDRAGSNTFLAAGNTVKQSFYAGNLEIQNPGFFCLNPVSGKISFFIEGVGESARITLPSTQVQC